MLNDLLPAQGLRAFRSAVPVTLYTLLSLLCLIFLSQPASAIESESLTTGIVPTMGINEVTEGTLVGQAGTQPWSLPVSFKQASLRSGISVNWARQRISALMDETYKGEEEGPIRKAILDVALAHHLVSRYTSLVAVDVTPARPTDKSTTEQEQRKGDLASVANLPKTSTSGQVQIVLGILAIMMASLMWGYRKRIA
jgi:LPXTG-motif cell wall-anchored protein